MHHTVTLDIPVKPHDKDCPPVVGIWPRKEETMEEVHENMKTAEEAHDVGYHEESAEAAPCWAEERA